MLPFPEILGADQVFAVDAPNELQLNLPNPLPSNIKALPLGQGHTARTLAARASSTVQKCISASAGMDAEAGLGQLRGIGYLATKAVLASHDVKTFIDETLFDLLMQKSGGVLDHVRIQGKGSLAGGTASAAVFLLTCAIAKAITDRSNAKVEVELTLTGAISYAGLGRRVHKNAAAATVDALDFVTSPCQHSRTIRSVRLMELPPVGNDRDTRARHMLEIEQASQTKELRAILSRNGPNDSLDGPLGNVTLWQSGHFRPLDPRFHVSRDIAPEYCRELRQALTESRPQPSLVQRLFLNSRTYELPREDVQSLCQRVATSDASELLATATLPGARLSVSVDAVLASGDVIRLSEAQTVWAASPTTLAEARSRLILQLSCIHALETEIARLGAEISDADHQRRLAEHQFIQAVRRLQSGGGLGRVFRAVLGLDQKQDPLTAYLREVRTATDQVQQYESELAALKHALQQVQVERDHVVFQLNAIISRLEALVPRGQRQQVEPTVVAKQIDAVFQDLWHAGDQTTDDDQSRLLLRAVDHVTLHGLALITGASSARLELIARQIANRQFVSRTPPWGGKRRLKRGREIHVLPPLTPENVGKLRQMIHELNRTCEVTVAEYMPASLNCVTFTITPVSRRREVLSNYLLRNLRDAYQDANREMYFPFGTSALNRLGISLNGQAEFPQTKGTK